MDTRMKGPERGGNSCYNFPVLYCFDSFYQKKTTPSGVNIASTLACFLVWSNADTKMRKKVVKFKKQ